MAVVGAVVISLILAGMMGTCLTIIGVVLKGPGQEVQQLFDAAGRRWQQRHERLAYAARMAEAWEDYRQ